MSRLPCPQRLICSPTSRRRAPTVGCRSPSRTWRWCAPTGPSAAALRRSTCRSSTSGRRPLRSIASSTIASAVPGCGTSAGCCRDAALQTLLDQPDHELHVARHDGDLVGYFELGGDELAFFGLTLPYIGRRIGPWLLDRAIERAFARGITRIDLNTNTLDHPKALDTYRKAGFRPVRSESKELRDPRVLWPEVYRWPPK